MRVRGAWAALLVACGAAPERPLPQITSVVVVGGAPSAGCLEGAILRVVRGDQQERWRLDAEIPTLEAVEPAGQTDGCLSSGQATLPAGRQVAWGPAGLFLAEAGEPLRWWRPAAGRLAAATWDGTLVRAVGADGLWQWKPGAAPTPILLPPELQGRDLTRVFLDGPLLWVGDAAVGAPLDLRGPVPVLVAPPDPLAAEDPGLQALLADHLVYAKRGVAGLTTEAGSVPTPGPVNALLPWDDLLLVAAGDAVIGYRWREGLEPALRLDLDGPTIALLGAAPNTLLLVGARYGFATVLFSR